MSTQFWSRREVLKVVWVLDEKARHRVLVENPATLYDFPKGV